MKYKSGLFAAASGSIGGLVFSHNAGGDYARKRSTPTNPQTLKQVVIRQGLANLTSRWKNILTEPQREAWRTYASNVPLPNAFGDLRNVSGICHYLRSNIALIGAGLAINDVAPVIFNLGEFSMISVAATESDQKISCTFDENDEWANEDDSFLLLYASRAQNDSIVFFKGPYNQYHTIEGNAAVPLVPPLAVVAPFAFEEGQKVFVQACVVRADGRVSTPVRTFCVAAA